MRFISMVGRMVSLDTLSRSALSRRAMIRGAMLGLVSGITLGLATSVASAAEEEVVFGDDYIPTVLISGANRGIGLEFAHQYADRGWRVIATCRKPDAAEELKKIADSYTGKMLYFYLIDEITAASSRRSSSSRACSRRSQSTSES